MSRRYTKDEKAKGPVSELSQGGRMRIRAPDLDTSALIQDNSLTLIGRVTNPQEQKIWTLISDLPKKWNLDKEVSGSDLGHDCFQFRFESEEDLRMVLANRPYHFCHWMVILQRWEPTISRSFPSHLPFWISLKGLPLHYWHQKMIYKMGHELGTLEDYEISKTSARMRILLDGLQPITIEAIVEYASGEESLVSLEYEGLENHCTFCYRLTHLRTDCPHAPYVNCPDPTESAARRQQVLDGEANGLMEETAARIIAQAKETAGASSSQAVGEENLTRHAVLRLLSPANEESQVQATLPALPRGGGRPPAPKRRTTLSRHLNGSVSRKNNLSRTQRLSGTGNGRDTTVGPSRRTPRSSIRRSNAPRQRRSTQITPSPNLHPPNASSPDIAAGQRRIRSELQDEQQGDFQSPYPKLP
ncbi:hypothetical protein BRARA_F00382 [Brassica rapa]|uniref:DUF4283 domain-containing protein n=1 Tax=Brassica campestris TaxID=3711 RepID=A0A397YYQ8_BRACM|nr:hypothetical protein BRARA_F00382 [Brassica rapa]